MILAEKLMKENEKINHQYSTSEKQNVKQTKYENLTKAEIHSVHRLWQIWTGKAEVSANAGEVDSEEGLHLRIAPLQLQPKSLRKAAKCKKPQL
jgi:hypothetical protein